MKHEKKIKYITTHIVIVLILLGGIVHVYTQSFSIPCCRNQLSVYADDDAYNWESVNQSDLVTAFRYYCKSRNLAIEGSIADAVTSFTTSAFNDICNTLGIDPTVLQAELKKTTGGNLGLRFLFTQTGVNAYNRIFAEFLQNNNLDVGDDVSNETVYSGELYTDSEGNSCLLFYIDYADTNIASGILKSYIVKYGSYYMMSNAQLYANAISANPVSSISVPKNNGSYYTISLPTSLRTDNQGDLIGQYIGWNNAKGYAITSTNYNIDGFPIVYKLSADNYTKLYVGQYYTNHKYTHFKGEYAEYFGILSYSAISSNNTTTEPANVNITTNNQTINNNNYNNNYTIIYNDGDVYYNDDDEEPLPTTPPSGGGGGGDNPSQPDPDNWNPTIPTIPDPSSPDFPSVEIPDIDIPDLPSLNFSLGDLSEKFPFSIPFDAIALLTVLDGEPQAPHIQATIPIGTYYTWELDADFSEFDNYARIFRAFEFIGFCIGLIWLTIHFVKG